MVLIRAALALPACAMTFPAMPTREQTQDEIRRTFVSDDKLYWLGRVHDDEVGLRQFSITTIAHKPLSGRYGLRQHCLGRLYATTERPIEIDTTAAVLF